jgi:hypothetical protein
MPRALSRQSALPVPTAEDRARRRADEIRCALVDAVEDYALAVLEEDWKTLGYDSVADWHENEFGGQRFTVETRRQVAELLSGAGQTQRAIAAATGVSQATTATDLSGDQDLITSTSSPKQTAARQRERNKRNAAGPDLLGTTKAEAKQVAKKNRMAPTTPTELTAENTALKARVKELETELAQTTADTDCQGCIALRERVAELEELLATREARSAPRRLVHIGAAQPAVPAGCACPGGWVSDGRHFTDCSAR